MSAYLKDAADVLDWVYDFGPLLAGDTIVSFTVVASPGIVLARPTTNTPSTVTAWLSGGATGQTYTVTFTVVTAAARTYERSIKVVVTDM